VLFADFTKAFDRAIRQLLYGWGDIPAADRKQHLLDLGVSEAAADWIIKYIATRGHLLQQWEADPTAAEMARTLHEGAWVAVSDLQTVVTTCTGGRQGCKLGGTTFCSVYGIALDMIAWELDNHGIVLRLPAPDGSFLTPPTEGQGSSQRILDAAFIDDEALGLVARTAEMLDTGIDVLLKTVFEVFDNLHLLINTEPGKTECLLQYRGAEAVARREARRDTDGRLRLKVPGRLASIDVVDNYKHLGTYTAIQSVAMAGYRHRTSSTWKAYAPISWKVFGSALIDACYKLYFARTLLLSRLLFGIYVLVPSPKQIKHLNGTYMTILRRIADEPRFQRSEHSDREIREKLDQPAIECIIAKMRLAYCGRLERVRPQALLALLHARPNGRRLKWVDQLECDTELLRQHLPPGFPTLSDGPSEWSCLMKDSSWAALISKIHFVASICDHTAAKSTPSHLQHHVCECGSAFASSRGLESHRRAKHGVTLAIQDRLPTSICPACFKDFRERTRLLNHVSNRKQTRCHDWIVQHCRKLAPAITAALREEVRISRRLAQRSGFTQPKANLPILRAVV
jgi:hypothetical protein